MYSGVMSSGGFGPHPSRQQPASPWDNFRLEDGAQLSLSLGGDVHPYQQVQNYLKQHDPLGLFSFGTTQDGNNLIYTFRQQKHSEGPYAGYYFLPDNPSSLALRKPDLYGEQQIADYLAKNPQLAPEPTGDPFLDFLMGQLGIAGLNQQPQWSPENELRMRFGYAPLPQLQPPPPPTLFDTTLNQLRGADSLLAQLLSGIQPLPARPAPPALLQPIPQQPPPAPATPEPPSLHDIWQVLWDSGIYGAKNARPEWGLPTYATDPRESFQRFAQKFSSDPSFAQKWMNSYRGLINGDIQIVHVPGGS